MVFSSYIVFFLSTASVQVSQYDEQFIQLFTFALTQLKQVSGKLSC